MLTKYGTDNITLMLVIGLVCIVSAILLYVNSAGSKPTILIAVILLVIGLILSAFTFWFFRDPERKIPDEALNSDSVILSPADGEIVEIMEIEENIFIKGRVRQISIFLSPLDVHVNRIPASGIVKYFKYYKGKYFVAYDSIASKRNEQTNIGIENDFGKIFFKQIVGILARRLVWDIKTGDTVKVGSRFGMMKFGSRMDVFIPANSEFFVNKGDKVIAGVTILAKLN